MISQQLFGECCEVLGSSTDWSFVRCSYDGYEGWCTSTHLTEIDGPDYDRGSHALTPDWVSEIEYDGHPMMIPMGSALTGMRNGQASWRKNKLHYKGKVWEPASAGRDAPTILQLAYRFLNTPYLWGGKSVFGVDCSGFTQTILKFFDVPLLRDAHQQATQGESVGFLEEALAGDLAFFDNEEGRITHVGILVNDHEIIHASGKVRVDKIDNMGIVHAENAQRTHRLRVIKRLLLVEK
jgi:cell wall-associated NlpC family hydrolase